MDRKGIVAILAVALMVISSVLLFIPSDTDGTASSTTYNRVDPNWITPSSGAVCMNNTGAEVIEIKAETTSNSNGSMSLSIYMRNSSRYAAYYIQMKTYNEPDNPDSDSFFYQSSSMADYTSSEWERFGGISGFTSAGTFKAVFYITTSSTSHTSISYTNTFTLEMDATVTKMYRYTTELEYDLNGGSGGPTEPTSQTDTSESPLSTVSMGISSVADMTRTDYIFQGWAISKDSTIVYQPGEDITVPAGQATTLYAVWVQDTVNVTLMDGDEVYQIIAVARGGIPSLPADLTKEDNTFVGWFEDAGTSVQWDTSKTVSENITLYAGWIPDLKFTTDPVADCRITKLGDNIYMFDATVSKDYSSSAASVEWKVYKGDKLEYESTGPYMTCQFTDYGTYSVELKITNSNGVSSVYKDEVVLEKPFDGIDSKGMVAIAAVTLLALIVIARMFI